jgi:hypothetical protein
VLEVELANEPRRLRLIGTQRRDPGDKQSKDGQRGNASELHPELLSSAGRGDEPSPLGRNYGGDETRV